MLPVNPHSLSPCGLFSRPTTDHRHGRQIVSGRCHIRELVPSLKIRMTVKRGRGPLKLELPPKSIPSQQVSDRHFTSVIVGPDEHYL